MTELPISVVQAPGARVVLGAFLAFVALAGSVWGMITVHAATPHAGVVHAAVWDAHHAHLVDELARASRERTEIEQKLDELLNKR